MLLAAEADGTLIVFEGWWDAALENAGDCFHLKSAGDPPVSLLRGYYFF